MAQRRQGSKFSSGLLEDKPASINTERSRNLGPHSGCSIRLFLPTTPNIFIKQQHVSRKNETLPEEMLDGAPDPHRTASARMDLDRVSRALSRMPSIDRLALVLRSEYSLPYEEIARILEISAGSARVKIHRARRRLLAQAMTNNGGE